MSDGVRRVKRPLGDGWPLVWGFSGFAIWWFLGLANVVWIGLGLFMLISLMMQDRTKVPSGFWIALVYLALAGVSILQVLTGPQLLTWMYRFLVQAVGVIGLVYAYNLDSARFPTRRLVDALAAYWLVIVAGGVLGILAPMFEFRSFAEMVLPSELLANPYLRSLFDPQVSQVHDFLGFPVNRPAAPFIYTNAWGSSLALTTPYFLLWAMQGQAKRRLVAGLALLVAIVPTVESLNRGLWLTLALAVVYAAVRYSWRGDARGLIVMLAGLIVVVTILLVTPLGDLIVMRAETGHSDDGRLALYTRSIALAAERPLTGFGGPVFDETLSSYSPPVGTHGHFWFVLVSYGVPAAIVLVLLLGWILWRTRIGPLGSFAFWTNVVFVIAAIQMFIYSFLPSQWPMLMIVAGAAMREVALRDGSNSDVSSLRFE